MFDSKHILLNVPKSTEYEKVCYYYTDFIHIYSNQNDS